MPKAKPAALNVRHAPKAEKAERRAAELSLAPVAELPDAPAALKGNAVALAVYGRLVALYSETIAEVVTAFDEDVLVDYCLALQEFYELRAMRGAWAKRWTDASKPKRGRQAAAADGDLGYVSEKLLALDARLDVKREKCQRLRESLYLTPRSRAGVRPPAKPAEPEKDEMEALLDEAREIIR